MRSRQVSERQEAEKTDGQASELQRRVRRGKRADGQQAGQETARETQKRAQERASPGKLSERQQAETMDGQVSELQGGKRAERQQTEKTPAQESQETETREKQERARNVWHAKGQDEEKTVQDGQASKPGDSRKSRLRER